MSSVFLSPSRFHDLKRSVGPGASHPAAMSAGMNVISNPLFPYTTTCPDCAGTGAGSDSTYCPKCLGRGGSKIVGMVAGDSQRMTLITEPMPRKFEPHWPPHIAVPLRRITP